MVFVRLEFMSRIVRSGFDVYRNGLILFRARGTRR